MWVRNTWNFVLYSSCLMLLVINFWLRQRWGLGICNFSAAEFSDTAKLLKSFGKVHILPKRIITQSSTADMRYVINTSLLLMWTPCKLPPMFAVEGFCVLSKRSITSIFTSLTEFSDLTLASHPLDIPCTTLVFKTPAPRNLLESNSLWRHFFSLQADTSVLPKLEWLSPSDIRESLWRYGQAWEIAPEAVTFRKRQCYWIYIPPKLFLKWKAFWQFNCSLFKLQLNIEKLYCPKRFKLVLLQLVHCKMYYIFCLAILH